MLFGRHDKLIVGLLQFATLLLLLSVGYLSQLGGAFYWSLLLAGALFIHQQRQIATRDRDACFRAFLHNNYVGLVVFIGIALSYI
ncbi:4-hydroxybenzoate octaprenyltransferase [Serratia odorifera]|uniref:4-hydroxybenzoate polyprenyltransferase n=1 Tax=Serratia odorifera TaxID=618 RepID=A0A3S5D792_SEROD|nr:4-hydroxybenzoate octaprenyltransferase [Serratia odorifera]